MFAMFYLCNDIYCQILIQGYLVLIIYVCVCIKCLYQVLVGIQFTLNIPRELWEKGKSYLTGKVEREMTIQEIVTLKLHCFTYFSSKSH